MSTDAPRSTRLHLPDVLWYGLAFSAFLLWAAAPAFAADNPPVLDAPAGPLGFDTERDATLSLTGTDLVGDDGKAPVVTVEFADGTKVTAKVADSPKATATALTAVDRKSTRLNSSHRCT